MEHIFDIVTLSSRCASHGESVLISVVLLVNFISLMGFSLDSRGKKLVGKAIFNLQFLTKAVVLSRPQYLIALTSGSYV